MNQENPLWGAPRIHGELLLLGFSVAQATVSKYMVRRSGGSSQGWKTFLHNHREGIVSIDLLTAPTIGFERLYAFVILRHLRREIIRIAVTKHPTAEWLARQITEAFPGIAHQKYSFATTTKPLARCFGGGSERWGSGTIRSRQDHPGRTAMLNALSARSDENVSTT